MARDGSSKFEAIRFAAGTATFMAACLGRAVAVSVFVHWRFWVFLALNLLLLAILFTSKSQVPSCQTPPASLAPRKRAKRKMVFADASAEISVNMARAESTEEEVKGRKDDEEKNAGEKEDDQLSKEELHRRAEAFIAMFRQQLVSDASNTRAINHVQL